jgi:PRTRC genetic system ThiF family protein
VGCGGTGSAIAGGLPYLHRAIIARGHPYGLHVTLQDGETISPANCVRQPFCEGEIGHNKAVILATRMNLFWGLRWQAIPRHLRATDEQARVTDIVIGCVDSAAARVLIADFCSRLHSGVRYWLDLGNGADEGQYLLGEPVNRTNSEGKPGRLPTSPERWPSIVDVADRPHLPSCSAAEALTRQAPFVNQVLANHALSLLAQLFAGGIEHHGAFINLATGKASPIPVPEITEAPEEAAPKNLGARARRRARRGAAA